MSESSPSIRIAAHVAGLPRSGIREFFELVQARKGVISLGVGEPDFVTPWHIREAAIFALEKGMTTYTSNLGMPRLREAVAKYVDGFFKVGYDPLKEVLITVGVSEALDLAFRALLEPGDEVIYHEPCYVSYGPSITLAYGVPVVVETRPENDFGLTAADVAAAITPRTRAIVLNFPTNPTGAVIASTELQAIADLAIKHDLIVITDEIYSELRFDGKPHVTIAALPGMKARTLLLHGFSKAFAMTGFRLGYACAPQQLIEAMMKIHQYGILCAPTISQAAAIEALENGAAAVEMMRRSYDQRRQFIVSRLNGMGLPTFEPGGAFYAFPDIRGSGLTSKEFAKRLLEEESVAAVPGDAFGACGEGFLRCCYATAFTDLREAMNRLEKFVRRLGITGAPAGTAEAG